MPRSFTDQRMQWTFNSWRAMHARCFDRRAQCYRRYGGRGIRVCSKWMLFAGFVDDMGIRPSRGHTIERINNNGHYQLSNCKWATRSEQANNTSANRRLTYRGETRTMKQWAVASKVGYFTLADRLAHGWSVAKALETPARTRRISDGDILDILVALRQTRETGISIARRYGVSTSLISHISTGRFTFKKHDSRAA